DNTKKIDGITDEDDASHVSAIGSSATGQQSAGAGIRYFKVKVAIDNPDDRLRPGMTSQVSIITSTAPNSPAVPIQSVVERVPPSVSKAKGAESDEDENLPKKKYVLVIRSG